MDRRNILKTIPYVVAAGFVEKPVSSSAETEDSKPLGLRYLERVRGMLEKIRNIESDNLLETAYHVARSVKNGCRCYNQWDMGHSTTFDLFPERNGDPGLFVNGYDQEKAKKGDKLLISILGKPMEDPRAKGISVIGAPAPWSAETLHPELLIKEQQLLKYRNFCDIWIDTGISTEGAIMEIPGESVKMGSVSGALGLMTFWMINADAVRILARDGVPVNVNGNEPKIKDEPHVPYSYKPEYNKNVSLEKPLGRDYFDTAMKQLKSIESEFGTVKRIAEMVVDTLLSGGQIFNYSRYENSLCNEAQNRRGGLLFNRGLYEGKNGPEAVQQHLREDYRAEVTGKDMVIMGIFQPDDPVDLKNLRLFRKIGAKVASIGAATKDGEVPDGDTIPKLSDAHLGMMCNTYGLFKVPGVDRKICPTSGLLLNQMFYAVQMQIAERIRERTGNNPRIDANAAMEGGVEKRKLDFEIIRLRGY